MTLLNHHHCACLLDSRYAFDGEAVKIHGVVLWEQGWTDCITIDFGGGRRVTFVYGVN